MDSSDTNIEMENHYILQRISGKPSIRATPMGTRLGTPSHLEMILLGHNNTSLK